MCAYIYMHIYTHTYIDMHASAYIHAYTFIGSNQQLQEKSHKLMYVIMSNPQSNEGETASARGFCSVRTSSQLCSWNPPWDNTVPMAKLPPTLQPPTPHWCHWEHLTSQPGQYLTLCNHSLGSHLLPKQLQDTVAKTFPSNSLHHCLSQPTCPLQNRAIKLKKIKIKKWDVSYFQKLQAWSLRLVRESRKKNASNYKCAKKSSPVGNGKITCWRNWQTATRQAVWNELCLDTATPHL